MGLDQFATIHHPKDIGQAQTDMKDESAFAFLYQWRKHPNLHGWMEQLYREKGGKDKDFNMESVRLDSGDIDRLEHAVKHDRLPRTEGFFFGKSRPECKAEDLEFIARARHAIERGYVVLYFAWW